MSGSNLPPGVSENMIPGNRPEDGDDEAFWELFLTKLGELGITSIAIPVGTIPPWMKIDDLCESEEFVKVVQLARDMGHLHGFLLGNDEAIMCEAQFEMEVSEHMSNYLADRPGMSAKSYLAAERKFRAYLKNGDTIDGEATEEPTP